MRRRLFLASALGARQLWAYRPLHGKDIRTPAPLPERSLLVVGFLGAWEEWDNEKRSVCKLASRLRARGIAGTWVETAGNHDRRTVLKFIRKARPSAMILYGQSFGGAAVVKLAREVRKLELPVLLTVQVDSVGVDDDVIPPNVARALNLYQRDPGPIRGQPSVRAADPGRTRILGNLQFTYLFRNVDMSDYPAAARRLNLSHFKMDNDPAVWAIVEAAIVREMDRWAAGASV
jgi:hypothetical protein